MVTFPTDLFSQPPQCHKSVPYNKSLNTSLLCFSGCTLINIPLAWFVVSRWFPRNMHQDPPVCLVRALITLTMHAQQFLPGQNKFAPTRRYILGKVKWDLWALLPLMPHKHLVLGFLAHVVYWMLLLMVESSKCILLRKEYSTTLIIQFNRSSWTSKKKTSCGGA